MPALYLAPMLRKVQPFLWIAAIAGGLWLILPFGFPNYDTFYQLVWGDELAHGESPDYGAARPPTPHPLAILWGVIVAPLGSAGAWNATTAIAYLALAAIAYLVYRLGSLWFDRPIGVVAALIVLTRPQFLVIGLRGYLELPYIALALSALVIETRRPRAGWPVLALLAVAGLLRPEAWLFSAAYLAYMALEPDPAGGSFALRRRRELENRGLVGLAALAASAPIAWGLFDLITTGEPFYSFTRTVETVEANERKTGQVDLVLDGPQRLREVMVIPALLGAAAGMVLGIALMWRRALMGIVAAVLAGVAFAILACTGAAILNKYLLLAASVLFVFCSAALLGWRLLPVDDPWRRRWQMIAVAVAVAFVIQAPQGYHYLSTEVTDLEVHSDIDSDLRHLADSGSFQHGCLPISVPNHRAIPWLAAWLDMKPSQIISATEQRQPSHGYYLDPANEDVESHFSSAPLPPRFRPIANNDSFVLYARCR